MTNKHRFFILSLMAASLLTPAASMADGGSGNGNSTGGNTGSGSGSSYSLPDAVTGQTATTPSNGTQFDATAGLQHRADAQQSVTSTNLKPETLGKNPFIRKDADLQSADANTFLNTMRDDETVAKTIKCFNFHTGC